MIELTYAEAEETLRAALRAQGVDLEAMNPELRAQAIVGVINAVRGLQTIGFRVSRPLKVVGG